MSADGRTNESDGAADLVLDSPVGVGSTERIVGHLGAIAQLGERLLCKQEVTGSIPVGSTELFGAQTAGAPTR